MKKIDCKTCNFTAEGKIIDAVFLLKRGKKTIVVADIVSSIPREKMISNMIIQRNIEIREHIMKLKINSLKLMMVKLFAMIVEIMLRKKFWSSWIRNASYI